MFDNNRDWRGGGPHGRGPQPFDFGRGRGPGRPERPLEQGDLRWLVLDLIAAQPRHGYEIIRAIEDMMNGHYTPSPGVIYPTLTFLEETGLISSEAQATKKLYTLTEEGRIALEANAAEVQSAQKANCRPNPWRRLQRRSTAQRGRLSGVDVANPFVVDLVRPTRLVYHIDSQPHE